ncbi:uncharacterized protein LOC103314132 [Tribolium castaneum]|uniref:Uncharacterized protein n=1 Tax=Tribolium castaneum TaxID=7070 RepID=D6WUQ1_TRICA|nr:hypothetical protein TcasGA2_TC006767 [Tribolium castaneum]
MGVTVSKSPLERRNTVLRRSQRRSIHGVKSKADKIVKEIKKFKASDESAYLALRTKIEALERDLKHTSKQLQPQLKPLFEETLQRAQQCYQLLEDKFKENQAEASNNNEDENDDVFVEETQEVPQSPKKVQLTLVQVEPIEASPQINKRFSAMKLGVPVLPGTILESQARKSLDSQDKVANLRQGIEKVELEISQFVGKKNGRYYGRIKGQLEEYLSELRNIVPADDEVAEQVKLNCNYVASCLTFLDEKAIDDGDDDDYDEVPTPRLVEERNLSPRSMRTTYI